MVTEEELKIVREHLTRIQQFDASTLSRTDALGTQLNFSEAVPSAEALIDIYKRISLSALQDFTDAQLSVIALNAQEDFRVFNQILDFDATSATAPAIRHDILHSLKVRRDHLFETMWQYIAYGEAKGIDTRLLETEVRATTQSLLDRASKFIEQLNTAKAEADSALLAIREVANEKGVSQQAHYFREEAEAHGRSAIHWLITAYCFATALGTFAIFSLALHKVPLFSAQGNAEMLQLGTSKFLIFAVLAYMLLMAVRNHASHKHNAVVNRHRENALKTYRALMEASGDRGTRDIVLTHASSCIFSPQETGFSQGKGESSGGGKSILEILTKSTPRVSE